MHRTHTGKRGSLAGVAAALATIATLAGVGLAAQSGNRPAPARDIGEVIARASRYVVQYGTDMALVIGVERYSQHVATSEAGKLGVPSGERPWLRDTVSEFALIRVGDTWLGYRDVYEVDGQPVGDRRDRLRQLFEQDPSTAVRQGRAIADESARYNAGAVQRNFNVPTMALMFLHPSNTARFRFDKAGTDSIDGTPVWKVRYRETRKPTIIRTPEGKDVAVKGTFWIDPVDGRVLRTFLEINGQVELAGGSSAMPESLLAGGMSHDQAADMRVETYSRVTTSYAFDGRLGLLLPAEMTEEYQGLSANRQTGRNRVSRISCKATYSDFKRYDGRGREYR